MTVYDGSIRIDTSIDTKGFDAGIEKLTGKMKGLAAAIAGALAGAFGIGVLANFSKDAVNAASILADAMVGLRSVVVGTGNDFNQAKKFLDEFTADGLVPMADAATAYKNLLSRGYDTRQIEQTLIRLKDAAAFGRQSSLSIGQAVKSASEGLRNENSILVDNAGVTKNCDVEGIR
jgi:phage tail tape-measure protein